MYLVAPGWALKDHGFAQKCVYRRSWVPQQSQLRQCFTINKLGERKCKQCGASSKPSTAPTASVEPSMAERRGLVRLSPARDGNSVLTVAHAGVRLQRSTRLRRLDPHRTIFGLSLPKAPHTRSLFNLSPVAGAQVLLASGLRAYFSPRMPGQSRAVRNQHAHALQVSQSKHGQITHTCQTGPRPHRALRKGGGTVTATTGPMLRPPSFLFAFQCCPTHCWMCNRLTHRTDRRCPLCRHAPYYKRPTAVAHTAFLRAYATNIQVRNPKEAGIRPRID